MSLEARYYSIANTIDNFKIAIVGKDPYPTKATGIPFHKEDWLSLLRRNSCGQYVLSSLGIDLVKAQEEFSSPANLFINLLTNQKIIFLNASYTYLGKGAKLENKKHLTHLLDAYNRNQPVFVKTKEIILCGQAEFIEQFHNKEFNFHKAIHPCIQNTLRPNRNKNWNHWWKSNSLNKKFLLKKA
jgi:hypothetical protein